MCVLSALISLHKYCVIKNLSDIIIQIKSMLWNWLPDKNFFFHVCWYEERAYTIRSSNYSRLNQTLIGSLITTLDTKPLSPQSGVIDP